MIKRPPPHLVAILGIALLVGSCIGTDSPTGVGDGEARVNIPIQPALVPSPADAGAAPINRIRARVERITNGQLLGETMVDVDPDAAEWEVILTAQLSGTLPVEARLSVSLINASGTTENVQFSGRAGPLTLTAGETVEPADIDIVRGPLANLFVTGVSVATAPDTMLEGTMAALVASATTSDTMPPQVYWTVIDSLNLLTIDSTVTALLPGTGRVIASAGAFSDTASIVVRPAPAAVLLSPDTAFIVGIGGQTTFSAVVVDARGDTLAGEAVTWSSGAPSVIGSVGAGVFDALGPGTGTVQATSLTSPAIVGNAVVVVGAAPPAAVDIAVSKTVDVAQPLEDSLVTFTVSVVNNGPDTANSIVVYDTFPAAPFISPGHSVSVGALDGDTLWTIPVLAPGDTATWTTAATVATGVAGGSATNTALLRSLAQNDSTPANDTSFVTVNFPFSAIPVVNISAPPDGTVYDPGDLVTFVASAADAEDGDLSPSIQWTSDVDGALGTGRTFGTSTLTTGVHTIAAAATDSDDGTGADTISITIALITTPTTLNVPFAATASLPITLSEPAQGGGITLTVTSDDESITRPTATTVFIGGGLLSANSTLEGVQPGVTDVTVSHPQFGASVTTVSVTAELNIVQGSLSVPETFPQPIDIRLQSQGTPTAAPAGGLDVTLTARNPSCAAVPASITIGGGLVEGTATVSAAVGATLPCTSWVVATSSSILPDSVNVNVTPAPALTVNGSPLVGAGLQQGVYSVSLGVSNHGGVTVRLESGDPAIARVSQNAATEGTAFMDVLVPNGQSFFYYYAHGMEGTTGTPTLTASAPGFSDGTNTVSVVTAAYQLSGLAPTRDVFDAEDPFWVYVGVPNGPQTALAAVQAVRIGGPTLTATIASSATSVGDLTTLPDSISPVTVDIAPGSSNSPTSVATGGVALRPLSAGATTVSASIPGLTATTAASGDVTISTPSFNVLQATVAAGLQTGLTYAVLDAAQHGGVTVTISSSDPAVMQVAPDAATPGAGSIDVFVPNGQIYAYYTVQGVEGQVDTTQVVVSAPGFDPDSAEVRVWAAAYDILGLATSLTSFSPDDAFYARLGYTTNGTSLATVQQLRAGASPLTVTFTSSDSIVGELITLTDSVSPVTAQILPGEYYTPGTVAAGGVAFMPITGGTTTVSASIPGITAMTNASRDVTVTAPGVTINDQWVGAGLQYGGLAAYLGATDHPGVTVRLESADPSVMLVSPNASTEGTAFIDVPVATGGSTVSYYIHGVEGTTGVVPLRMTAAGFVTDSAFITVDTPSFDIVGLLTSQTTFSPDDPFYVRVGRPYAGNPSIWIPQAVRVGGNTLTVTVTNSNSGVGLLETTALSGQSVTVQIPPGSATSPTSVAAGGVDFDPLGIGTTTVAASIPGLSATTAGSQVVTVSAPPISLGNWTVGAGLQYGSLPITLGSGGHGGVTVTLTSSNPDVFRVSPDATTEGTGTLDVVIPDGQQVFYFYLHGMEGVEATANLTVTAPGFTNGIGTMTVVRPALDIQGLATTQAAAGADDPFYVRLGIPNVSGTALQLQQALRVNGATVTATVTSSVPIAAQLVTTPTTGGTVTVDIVAGDATSSLTVLGGGVALDPLAAGTTTVTATIPGFTTTTTNGVRTVTITP